ncbi:hypothetical protein WR25_01105 isoform A [Diploscapter pachys]|uniref:phosphatidylinositol-3,5-bisphosphate 3-phosphatase n=3 Tax=Diploscapter pachys TaxID=2018661 RepID=A0A2A2J309_9BILA|nr:hypothetical protein WR25_01105 isoform A [Diploscapter pachys]
MPRESSHAVDIPSNRRSESSYDELNSPQNSFVTYGSVVTKIDLDAVPKPDENENDSNNKIDLICGEELEADFDFENLRLILTNYRLCTVNPEDQSIIIVPLLSMESVDFRDLNQIFISCKDGRVVRLSMPNQEEAIRWHKKLLVKTASPQKFSDTFSVIFSQAISSSCPSWIGHQPENEIVKIDFNRLEMKDGFKIVEINKDYEICETYPERIIVPANITEQQLKVACKFRSMNRLPAVVWKNKQSGAVLLRSSQPLTTLFSWRNPEDERIIEEVIKYTKERNKGLDGAEDSRHMVILDARSYAAAWANRAKGGGFESYEYYQQTEIMFLGLPNIHNVRYSFTQLRNLLTTIDQVNYHQNLQASNWLIYLSNLLIAANKCADFLQQGTSVLVHCSDGWDRTTQIVSLAKLILDEHYRTIKGFEELIRREWLAFGHKFADRSGIGCLDANERSPVFLQWLDAVRQLQSHNSTLFQFNHQYLIKLARHTYSGLFETFLFNSLKQKNDVIKETMPGGSEPISIWQYLGDHNEEFVNPNYDEDSAGRLKNLNFGIQHLKVWLEVYTCMNTQPQPELATLSSGVNGSISVPITNSTIPPSVSPNATPTASIAPNKEGGQAMTKSKSSESLNSLTKETDGTGMAMGNGLNGQHSGSNGTVNSTNDCHVSEITMHDSIICRGNKERQSRTLIKRKLQDSIAQDGLEIFHDDDQEIARKKQGKYQKIIEKKDKTIKDLKQMNHGDKTPIHHREIYPASSVAESDLDESGSLNRSFSEMSVIDSNEAPQKSKGWSIEQNSCQLCSKQWNPMSIYPESREHHCRQCERAVCLECSPHTFQTFKDGRSVHERACKECYVSMGGVSEMSDDKTPEKEFNDVPGSSTERLENNDATNNAPQNALTTPSVHSNNSSSSTPQKIATASPKPSMSQNQSYSPSQAVKG